MLHTVCILQGILFHIYNSSSHYTVSSSSNKRSQQTLGVTNSVRRVFSGPVSSMGDLFTNFNIPDQYLQTTVNTGSGTIVFKFNGKSIPGKRSSARVPNFVPKLLVPNFIRLILYNWAFEFIIFPKSNHFLHNCMQS